MNRQTSYTYLSATFFNRTSSFPNLAAVVVVTNKKRPFPTMDAEIYAFLSLSLIAGVSVVNVA